MDFNLDLDADNPPSEPPKKKKLTKAEKRAAKKLQAEERKKQLRRDHLQRELNIAELNWKTLKWKFMNMLRRVKLPQMREDAMTVWHVFDRTIDIKNFTISRLLDFLDETEVQYEINLNENLETIDGLIAFYIKRMNEMQTHYKIEASDTKTGADDLQSSIRSAEDKEEGQLQAIMIAMEQNFQNYMTYFSSDSIAKMEDDRNRSMELLQNLRVALEHQIELLWHQLKGALVDYQKSTTELRNQYRVLKVQDISLTRDLQHQLIRTQELYELIRKLKERLASVRETMAMIISDLMDEKQYFLNMFTTLRNRLKDERAHDLSQLTTLTVESNASLRWLESIVNKGERILKMAAICRKMETQEEKVCPFPNSTLSTSYDDDFTYQQSSDSLVQVFQNFQDMELFWLRVGQADLKRAEIAQCYDLLVLENHYLYHGLQHYMAGLPPVPLPAILRANYEQEKDPC